MTLAAALSPARVGARAVAVAVPGSVGLPAILVAALAFDDGGYWPTAWGWGAVALAWVALLRLSLTSELRLAPLDVACMTALAAFVTWVAASSLWSESRGRSMLELERDLLYLAAVGAVLLSARRGEAGRLVLGVWAGIAAPCAYALATRLLPGRLGGFDSVGGYRLSTPLGYWNGLGAFAAMGALLALGCASSRESRAARLATAASLPVLTLTVYFTFSRGAWIALLAGLVTLAFAAPRTVSVSTLLLALPAAVTLAFAYRLDSLTEVGALRPAAIHEGRQLMIAVLLASVTSALVSVALARGRAAAEAAVPAGQRRVIVLVAAAALVGFVVHAGGPAALVGRVDRAFQAPPPSVRAGDSANGRLFSLSGSRRLEQWKVAADQARPRPLVGTGAGTYELHWLLDRPVAWKIRDAHSLYLESAAELGVVGLALLLAALAIPLAAFTRARDTTAAPVALAAYVTFLVHASVDWDWELPALTVAALLCGGAIVVAARREPSRFAAGGRLIAATGAFAVAGLAAVGLLGNAALRAASDALARGDGATALAESSAANRWAPWSAEPLRLTAAAESLLGRDAPALATARQATRREPRDWNTWFDRAQLAQGSERRSALARAHALNPLSPELMEFVAANGLDAEPAVRR